jgi:cobalt-zinc-cadmium efflux system outer membrane protein
VERQFVEVLSLQARVVTERRSLDTIEKTAQAITKRVAAGEDSRLDGNLAQVEAIRARNQIGLLQEQLMQPAPNWRPPFKCRLAPRWRR